MTTHPPPPDDIVDRLRRICNPLPGAVEHDAWTGTSWRVNTTTFAHVVQITDAWPPAYARAFDTAGPATVVTFQAEPDERRALDQIGPPFHRPRWRPGIVGLEVDEHTDWTEVDELLTDSHRICTQTPTRSARRKSAT